MSTAIELSSCIVDYIADVTMVDASLRSPNQAFGSAFRDVLKGLPIGETRWAPLSYAAESSCWEAR